MGGLGDGCPGDAGGHVVADELVEECADKPTGDRADDVDGNELVEVGRSADQATEQLGTDLARRVERGAGDRADEDDDPVDDEPDDDPGEATGCPVWGRQAP